MRSKDLPNYWQKEHDKQNIKLKHYENALAALTVRHRRQDKYIKWIRGWAVALGLALLVVTSFIDQIAYISTHYLGYSFRTDPEIGPPQLLMMTFALMIILFGIHKEK